MMLELRSIFLVNPKYTAWIPYKDSRKDHNIILI